MTIKRFFKFFTVLTLLLCLTAGGFVLYGDRALPDRYWTVTGDVKLPPLFSLEKTPAKALPAAADADANAVSEQTVRFLGAIPVKTVTVTKTERRYVTVGGELVGIRLRTEGVTVVGTESFETEAGAADPAKDAGIKTGDVILRLDGSVVDSNKKLTTLIENSGGRALTVELERENQPLTLTLTPQRTKATGTYKGGLWVRDATAGIGTLTFTDSESGRLGALGHAIFDADTGDVLRVRKGAVFTATAVGVSKGVAGRAGEIEGKIGETQIGSVDLNTHAGVYGDLLAQNDEAAADRYPVATASEVHTGSAQICCTVSGTEKQFYDIEIDRIYKNGDRDKNMTVTVTDTALLAATGGIVQGMSGSPILQDGRFVGAITHVFVSNPAAGYAIFAEKMLETAENDAS